MCLGFNFVLAKLRLFKFRLLHVSHFGPSLVCAVRAGQVASQRSIASVWPRRIHVVGIIYRYYCHFAIAPSLVRFLVLLACPVACFQSPEHVELVPSTPSSGFNRNPNLKK